MSQMSTKNRCDGSVAASTIDREPCATSNGIIAVCVTTVVRSKWPEGAKHVIGPCLRSATAKPKVTDGAAQRRTARPVTLVAGHETILTGRPQA